MKQLPRILPRSSVPDKSLSVRASLPSQAPKEASGVGGPSGHGGSADLHPTASSGGVKVIAMATLPQQQGGPVPVMFLPQSCLSFERDKVAPPPPLPLQQQHAVAAPTSVVQKARGSATKRLLEGEASGGGAAGVSGASAVSTSPVKRKRGRPRKPRPEDSLPAPPVALPPQPPPPPHPSQQPIITSLTGGVIQKASSSSSSSSQPVVELVIQEPSGLVLSQLPAVSDPAHRLLEHRGVVVQCQTGGTAELDHHSRPLLVFQSPGNPGWELASPGRTQMVEVIQKAPRPSNNNSTAPPQAAQLHLPPLPLPKVQEDRGEVEITLMPVDLNVSSPPSSSTAPASSCSLSSAMVVKLEDEEEGNGISNRKGL